LIDPLIALGLGLLVGLQKERVASPIAGFKTFGLAGLFGAVTALLAPHVGNWLLGVGFFMVLGVLAIGNAIQMREHDANPGQTTEVALLVTYGIGALTVIGPRTVAIVLGGAVAVLLYLRSEIKGMVARMNDRDVRAIMQFVLVWLVVLPLLPDRTFGPFDVLNPHNVWLMVVLIVGLNLAGYAAFRGLSRRGGTAVAGLLGGVISSTATTLAYARNARAGDVPAKTAALIVWLASGVVYVRVLIEIAAVAPRFLPVASVPVLGILAVFSAAALVLWHSEGDLPDSPLEPKNPTQLSAAVIFGGLYAGVLFAVAAAEAYLGDVGLYAAALLSGVTDMDAITLSTSRLVAAERLDASLGWRLIVAASMSNLVFKLCIAWIVGGAALGRRLAWLSAAALATGSAFIFFWT
jgi:uncharacterized membrane protein (DUF4010 family)